MHQLSGEEVIALQLCLIMQYCTRRIQQLSKASICVKFLYMVYITCALYDFYSLSGETSYHHAPIRVNPNPLSLTLGRLIDSNIDEASVKFESDATLSTHPETSLGRAITVTYYGLATRGRPRLPNAGFLFMASGIEKLLYRDINWHH